MSRKIKKKSASDKFDKPSYSEAIKAVNYWVLFDDMAAYFQQAKMPVVSEHLNAVCQEIDRIWVEGDFEDRDSEAQC